MFRATMCQFLKDGLSLREFVDKGAQWAQAYENDLQTYLSGFSFEETKRKIAEEHARFTEQIAKVLGDITVKVLSLPISIVVALMLKAQAVSMPWLLPLMLLMVAFVIVVLSVTTGVLCLALSRTSTWSSTGSE